MEVWKTDGETERCNSQVIGAFCLCRASLGADTFVVCHFARFSVHCATITDSCEVPVRVYISAVGDGGLELQRLSGTVLYIRIN